MFVIGALFIAGYAQVAFVLPKMAKTLFSGMDKLPLPTRIMLGVSDFVSQYGLIFIVSMVVSIVLLKYYIGTPDGAYNFDLLKLNLPKFGAMVRSSVTARFSQMLNVLTSSGVQVVDALSIAAETVDNEVFEKALKKAKKDVLGGIPKSVALESKYMPAMAIGLINDLAVGCAGDGSEFKSQNELFADNAHVGAPPDPWAEHGQNWGLPALNPQKLSKDHFAFYRSLIRANMEDVGGLRIDHVMAIRRLWWCFENNAQQDGCYVYYPFEQLLAVLKIESHLNQCVVIGEDLGVVPNEVREALKASAIYSNGLFYFEKDHQGDFLAAEHFAPHSLLMIANHDVPPFKGWWVGHDITIKQQYGLLDEAQTQAQFDARNIEKHRMLNFISRESNQHLSLDTDAFIVYEALASSLAAAPAKLFTIQIDDLDQQILPVNIPGTDKEYPNWRRLLSRPAAQIIKTQQTLLANLISIRNQ